MFLRQAASFLQRIRLYPSALALPIPKCGRPHKGSHVFRSGGDAWIKDNEEFSWWVVVAAQAAIFLGTRSNPAFADGVPIESISENNAEAADIVGLRRIDDGSVVSNIHTTKWRVFTDKGRDAFLQGKLEEAERFFLSALQEAKEGFGERDPHVASSCNNLAELYRVMKAFDKAEPLYLKAVRILEESFGPQDIRVAVAFHNLGQFYLAQRKLEEAQIHYERALEIKGRVLGYGHQEYADTMYHLGMVLYLQGKEKESEALILHSIRILEEAGQGESMVCLKRLRRLAQMYLKSSCLEDAENVQRKILHMLEVSKSLEIVLAAEGLALTLQTAGKLREAQELLERCLEARRTLLTESHIQVAANMLRLARVGMLISNQLRKGNPSEAIVELDKAKGYLDNSIRIAREVLNKSVKQRGRLRNGNSAESGNNGRLAMVILLQSFDSLGLLGLTKRELLESRDENSHLVEAEDALLRCMSSFKEFAHERSVSGFVEIKVEYVSCLKHLASLIEDITPEGMQHSQEVTMHELKQEISRVEKEISQMRRNKK
ncbi:kinesin light chain 3 isoform X2 [Rhodamnia argentea]|uniref:Kinesin light chain 3 isoform X2 n=1 Tax=Rhodamnia argentea TaxID=178133 RepID=A0ABM3H1C3_9MYRT|nr:kinesin light chain 3 isoform X2 [Rhodamnia argentea]